MTIRTVQSEDSDETTSWLCYWTVLGLFQTVELLFGFILYFIPYYSVLRLAFFFYIMAPQTQGAKVLYLAVFKPLLKKHEKDI